MAITVPQSFPKKVTLGEKLVFKHFSSLSDNYFVHFKANHRTKQNSRY